MANAKEEGGSRHVVRIGGGGGHGKADVVGVVVWIF